MPPSGEHASNLEVCLLLHNVRLLCKRHDSYYAGVCIVLQSTTPIHEGSNFDTDYTFMRGALKFTRTPRCACALKVDTAAPVVVCPDTSTITSRKRLRPFVASRDSICRRLCLCGPVSCCEHRQTHTEHNLMDEETAFRATLCLSKGHASNICIATLLVRLRIIYSYI